jgi:hypothetical protein
MLDAPNRCGGGYFALFESVGAASFGPGLLATCTWA